MKKILPLALSLCGGALLIASLVAAPATPAPVTPPAPAMGPGPRPGPDNHGRALLAEKLSLTDEQRKRLEDIRAEINQRRHDRQNFTRARGGPQGFRPSPQGHGFAPQPGQPGQGGMHPSSPMEMIQQGNRMAAEGQKQLARELGLSEEQSNRMRDLARQHQEKAQAMQKDFHDQMQGILTPEQREKAKAMHERRGPDGGRPDRGPGPGHDRRGPPPDMPPPGK